MKHLISDCHDAHTIEGSGDEIICMGCGKPCETHTEDDVEDVVQSPNNTDAKPGEASVKDAIKVEVKGARLTDIVMYGVVKTDENKLTSAQKDEVINQFERVCRDSLVLKEFAKAINSEKIFRVDGEITDADKESEYLVSIMFQ